MLSTNIISSIISSVERNDLAMSLNDDYLASLDTDDGPIRQLLQHAGVAQADIGVEKYGSNPEQRTSQQRTFYESGGEARGHSRESDGTSIYAIGSLTKLLIAVLISTIVDKLSYSNEPEDEPYRKLRKSYPDPWNTTFTKLFNTFSGRKMSSLPKNPTLRYVLLHVNSLPPMNWILLAPDGTSTISTKEFLDVAPRLAEAAYRDGEGNNIEYSNGNYILIGLLIQAIAPPEDTLQKLMKKHIFKPLGMNRTYMNRSDLGDVLYARPHVVSTNGRRPLIHLPGFRADAIVNFAMGAFSCTRDIAILLRNLLASLDGDEAMFKKDFVLRLLQPQVKFDEAESDTQTLCGIHTTLDTSTPGSRSINRLITPTKYCSTYRLGVRDGKDVAQVPAYYMTGAVHGYASCFYLMPKHRTFVIVLTDTSGRIDSSDHISRFILQDIFDLKRTSLQIGLLGTKLLNKNLDLQASDLTAKVDIINMSSRDAQEGQNLLTEWEKADAGGDVLSTLSLQLDGTYCNNLTHQSIVIRSRSGQYIVNIMGDADISRDIGLHRTGDFTFRLYPLDQDGFTIDRHELSGWKELSFQIEVNKGGDGNQKVVGVERQGDLLPSTSMYTRTQESSGNLD
jgi:CubicO group peptidase (beta-lactamase class C family)